MQSRSAAKGVVAGVTPGKGGQQVHGVPVYNTVKEAMKDHDIGAGGHLRPRRCSSRRDHGGGECRYRHHRLHHRAHPGAGHDEGDCVRPDGGRERDRPQLPRAPLARRSEDGDHAVRPLLPRECGRHLPVGHPHLRGRGRAHPGRHRPEHRGRDRRRPGHRPDLCRCA